MRILFTTSNSLLSRIICAVTREPVSHVAIEYHGWVVHSNLRGINVELLSTFTKKSRIVYSVDAPFDVEKLMSSLSEHEHRSYDIGALLYLGLRYLLPVLPKKNLWQTSGMFICTEWVTKVLNNAEDSMVTPYGLYIRLMTRAIESPDDNKGAK